MIYMDRESFSELLDMLEGLEWFVFSGMAVSLYTEGDRDFNDVDIVVREGDIEEFADRVGAEVRRRDFIKKGNHINDRAFETIFKGIEVEATSGFPEKRMEEDLFDKLFDKTETKKFMGREVNLVPLEELIVHKAKMDRNKDRPDLRRLNNLEIDTNFVLELVDDWGLDRNRVLRILEEEGIEIKE